MDKKASLFRVYINVAGMVCIRLLRILKPNLKEVASNLIKNSFQSC